MADINTDISPRSEDHLSKCLSNLLLNKLNDHEIQIHKTIITTNKTQQSETKLKEFDQWRRVSL